MNAVCQLLNSVTVGELGTKKVLTIPATTSVKDTFEFLIKNKILSAPIYDETEKEYTGLVDLVDIVHFVVELLGDVEFHQDLDLWDIVAGKDVFVRTAVKDISDLSQRNPFCSLPKTVPLLDVCKTLVNGAFGNTIHRVCVTGQTDKAETSITAIVSQSDVIAFINSHLASLAGCPLLDKTVQEVKLGIKTVVTIKENRPCIEAFRLMHDNQVSGIGIVDNHGTLIGNVSARDLKGIIRDQDHRLLFTTLFSKTVFDLIKEVRQAEIHESSKTRVPAITVMTTTTVRDVVRKLAATRIHRVFVKNTEQQLVGVISLRDVIDYFTQDIP